MTNKPNGTRYIGQTDDLGRRVWEHQQKMVQGFTKRYNLDTLVWYDVLDTRDDARTVENRMKAWKRAWKIAKIEERNPEWRDLSNQF